MKGASLLLFPVLFCVLIAQQADAKKSNDKKVIKQLKADIGYLASDSLEGRRTSTVGERKAGDYIISVYEKEGIVAYKGVYRYPFKFVYGKEIAASTQIRINGNAMHIGKDVFPMPFSESKKAASDAIPDVPEQGNVWVLPLYQSKDEADDAHFDWEKYVYEKSKDALKQGATGVLFYDSYGAKYTPEFNGRSENETINLPVAFVGYEPYQQYVSNKGSIPIELNLAIKKTDRVGTNIAAYLDNGAKYTVVLGAHYDHLGYGEDGSSLYGGKAKLIHNGADDNASGTAALLQMASWLKKSKKLHTYNYLFVNFSGEELGLLGSKAFVKDLGIDSNQIAYMINMDMVGRLNDSTHALTLGGIGSSPVWAELLKTPNPYFKVNLDSAGIGPSDHSSFYQVGIPVLFFFTGTHSDYHKPSDDADKINYMGEAKVMHYVYDVVSTLNDMPKPKYTIAKQSTVGKVRFKITLGIMPDYSYQENGVRVDGLTEGKPASNAGIVAGDIIIQLGTDKINGMQSYMESLSHLKAGDKTEVKVLRQGKEISLPIEFPKN
ncbi:MAG: M28 family peptidase [Bacteroidota bacterium]